MKTQSLVCLACAAFSVSPLSAGDFMNLDFEHPDLSHAVLDAMVAGDFRAPTKEALEPV